MQSKGTSRTHRQRIRWTIFAALVVIALLVNLPIILMVINSFKTNAEILSSQTSFPVTSRSRTIRCSVRGQTSGPISAIASSSLGARRRRVWSSRVLAGYALSRFRSAAITVYSRALLMFQMFPLILALIPLFILFRDLRLINTYLSVIIIYTTVHLALRGLAGERVFRWHPARIG